MFFVNSNDANIVRSSSLLTQVATVTSPPGASVQSWAGTQWWRDEDLEPETIKVYITG